MSNWLEAEEKRATLRKVVAYRDLCNSVRRSSTNSLVFGAFMLAIWYYLIPVNQRFQLYGIIYLTLACLEFCTGLLNRLFPSAEGVLLEGLVLASFGGWNVVREFLIWQKIMPGMFSPIMGVLGVFWFFQGIRVMRSYFDLRRLFAQRPTSEHLRYFELLINEMRFAEPEKDPQALVLRTNPLLRLKLLGDTAFILFPDGNIEIVAREDVRIELEPAEDDPDRPHAYLTILERPFRPFRITKENWLNYQTWKEQEIDDLPEARPIG